MANVEQCQVPKATEEKRMKFKFGCWVMIRGLGKCLRLKSKVDTKISNASAHCESKSANDSTRESPAAPVVSDPRTSYAECSLSTSIVGKELKITSQLRKFSFHELKSATRNFRTENILSEGGFGSVFKGWVEERGMAPARLGTGLAVAVKTLNHCGVQGHKEWMAEVNFLGNLLHPNLVKLIGYCIEDDQRLLVYEFMPRGSLENHLFGSPHPLPWFIRMKIALGAAQGLAFLHEEAGRPIIYRDFKTSKILLDRDFNAKLSDFGLAKEGPEGDNTHVSTRVMGTYGYAAPEYILTGNLTSKSDIYSFGVVLLELLTGLRVMDRNRPQGERNLLVWARPYLRGRGHFYHLVDPCLQGNFSIKAAEKISQLVHQCFSQDHWTRPCMREVVEELKPLLELRDIASSSSHFPKPTARFVSKEW